MSQQTELVEFLTPEEELELDKYETDVVTLSTNVLENARRVGEILTTIKEKKLYAKARRNGNGEVFSDFAEYAKARFGRGKTMSYNYVAVFNIMQDMEDVGVDPLSLGTIKNALAVHHEMRRLTRVNEDLNPLFKEILAKGMSVIENICPIDPVTGELIVTPDAIQAAFSTIGQIASSGHYEIDGEQVPMELGKVAIDDQASREMYEQVQRRRLLAGDDARQKKNKIFEAKPLTQITAKADAESVYLICPRHGTVHALALLQGGIRLACRCRAIIQFKNNESMLVWFPEE